MSFFSFFLSPHCDSFLSCLLFLCSTPLLSFILLLSLLFSSLLHHLSTTSLHSSYTHSSRFHLATSSPSLLGSAAVQHLYSKMTWEYGKARSEYKRVGEGWVRGGRRGERGWRCDRGLKRGRRTMEVGCRLTFCAMACQINRMSV